MKIISLLAVSLLLIGVGCNTTKPFVSQKESQSTTTAQSQVVSVSVPDAPVVNFSNKRLTIVSDGWNLDGFAVTDKQDVAIYAAYHPATEQYGIFRFDVSLNSSTPLKEFTVAYDYFKANTEESNIFSPQSAIQFSPDETKFWWWIPKTPYYSSKNSITNNSIILDFQGKNEHIVFLPDDLAQFYWFSNNELAFGGATYGGSGYDNPYIQIYNINTGKIRSTKIPTRGDFGGMEPRINPAATAYASYDVVNNSALYCGQNLEQLIVRSYPDGTELYRLEDVHKVSYRWLNSSELEIHFTRAPGVYNTKIQQGFVTSTEQVTCIDETMIYKLPKK